MNILRTAILMSVMTLLLVWAGGMLGGQSGALMALIFAGVMNLGSYWFSHKIVIRMYRGRESGRRRRSARYPPVLWRRLWRWR